MPKQSLASIAKSVRTAMKKHSPEILTGIGIAGMITTTVMAVKATPKALILLEEKKDELDTDRLEPKDIIKAAWPCYIPAAVVGSISVFCLIGASSTNLRRNAALATAYTLSESTLKEYQEKVVETIGEKKEQSIRDSVSKDKMVKNPVREVILTESGGNTICYDVLSGRYFKSDRDKITRVMNELNRQMRDEMYVMLHSLTIEPISQGFEEYELKMGSIQTIMMSTGASLEEVNKYLQELNTYSDKTIYSFQDMTSNIGKFTNAGVGLEDAVMAIQGVSNVAAVSGANANEASRAMYNFAQALSAGYVKLIDWKSIENANMATVEFKTQLLESAVACGTLTKTADGMYKTVKGNVIDATHGFNDSLQDQWMTTEALVGTLRNYADETTEIGAKAFAAAQDVKTFTQLMDTLKEAVGSGWANTWEILFGDFEEAKELWTGLSQVIGGFIDAQADAEIGVTIYIHAIGPASNINIYNTETREVMKIDTVKLQKLTGKGIVASDDIVINTSKGDKSITLIREGVSYNILNCLDKNTDWFTLAKGDNIFAFTADSGVTNLQFRIENKVIYEGV